MEISSILEENHQHKHAVNRLRRYLVTPLIFLAAIGLLFISWLVAKAGYPDLSTALIILAAFVFALAGIVAKYA